MKSVYQRLGLPRVINAAGKMTALGVSTIHPETGEALLEAANAYVEIERLYAVAGKALAKLVNAPDACIVNSASAGLAMCVAALITQGDEVMTETLPLRLDSIQRREVILLKGHSINYGGAVTTALALGGAKIIEVGHSNKSTIEHVAAAINPNTIAIYYIKSHHSVQKNMVSLEAMIKLGKERNIPVVVDAAAESDLSRYLNLGANMVVYSGAKAICGPTSGFVACSSEQYADWLRLQFKGIGRSMKIGKEGIMGLLKAVEVYLDDKIQTLVSLEELEAMIQRLNEQKGIHATLAKDESRPIYRVEFKINPKEYGMSALELVEVMKKQDPAIYFRDHYANLGILEIDPRGLAGIKELNEIEQAILAHGGQK